MTGSAMQFSIRANGTLALAAALFAAPLAAQSEENVRDRNPDVRDIAATPITDLNLTRDEIPQVLVDAATNPYANDGLDNCSDLGGEIALLDRVLGADLDIDTDERRDITVGKVAKSAVGSLIPFRGIIREITGAADHQRNFEEAILAGAVRRGYLKGLGEQMGCAYPARPAFAKVKLSKSDRVEVDEFRPQVAAQPERQESEERAADGTLFVSEPVVQETGD